MVFENLGWIVMATGHGKHDIQKNDIPMSNKCGAWRVADEKGRNICTSILQVKYEDVGVIRLIPKEKDLMVTSIKRGPDGYYLYEVQTWVKGKDNIEQRCVVVDTKGNPVFRSVGEAKYILEEYEDENGNIFSLKDRPIRIQNLSGQEKTETTVDQGVADFFGSNLQQPECIYIHSDGYFEREYKEQHRLVTPDYIKSMQGIATNVIGHDLTSLSKLLSPLHDSEVEDVTRIIENKFVFEPENQVIHNTLITLSHVKILRRSMEEKIACCLEN